MNEKTKAKKKENKQLCPLLTCVASVLMLLLPAPWMLAEPSCSVLSAGRTCVVALVYSSLGSTCASSLRHHYVTIIGILLRDGV
jgi:hypothetical protein